jgi:2-polyprenyl-6-methoxyphenol hydroxylase-like FAD-dependent oxidoreductase
MPMSTVAVVGGGLVGSVAAIGLARLGFEVTLIEREAPQVQRAASVWTYATSPCHRHPAS